jgi:cytochrome c-type biogenesis protein CcmH
MRRFAGLVLAILFIFGPSLAQALDPSEILADPALEARARTISQGLRCLVCQNESIEDSGADLAHDLRVLVRERVKAGDTDDQVRQYIVSRYGEFVLLQPVLAPHTLILWFAAPALVLVGIGVLVVLARRRHDPLPTDLSAEEAEALERLVAPEPADDPGAVQR